MSRCGFCLPASRSKGDQMRVLGVWLAMVLLAAPAWCQASRNGESAAGRWEVYGGLALTGPNSSDARWGGGGGICGYPLRWLGVQGDFSVAEGNTGSTNNTTLTDYLAGPRLARRLSQSVQVSPFVDYLVGVQHLNNASTQHSYYYATGSGAAQAADGGMDIRVNSRVAVRAQAGGVFSHFAVAGGSTNGATNIRWRAGVYLVFQF